MGVHLSRHVSGEDEDLWGGEEGDFPCSLGDFPHATCLDWALMGDPCKGIDVTLEVTPRKGKGRRELINLECSIDYDVKGTSSRLRKSKTHARVECLRRCQALLFCGFWFRGHVRCVILWVVLLYRLSFLLVWNILYILHVYLGVAYAF